MDETLTYEEISSRATSSAVSVMLRGIAIRAIGLLGNVFLARLLVPREFGIVAIGVTIVNIGDFLGDGGLAPALVRQEGPIERPTLQAIFGFQLLLTVTIAALVTAVGVPLGSAGAVAAVMVWSLVFDTGRVPNTIVLERQMKYRLVLQAEIAETIVWNLWAVVAVLLGAGVWGVASAQVARGVTGYLMLSFRGPNGFMAPSWSWARVRPLLRFGLKFQGFSVIALGRDQAFMIGIAAVGGLVAAGVWSIVYRLTLMVGILLESLWRVSFPAMSRLREAGTPAGPIILRSLGIAMILVGALAVPLGGSAPALVPVVFGPSWHAVVNVAPLAAGGLVLSGPLGAVLIGYLLAEDRAGVLMRMAATDAVVLLAVGLPLLAVIGINGLGIGALAAAATDAWILIRAVARGWRINLAGPMAGPILAAVVAGIGAWIVAARFGANVGSLAASVVVGEAAYVALVILLAGTAVDDSLRVARGVSRRFAHAA